MENAADALKIAFAVMVFVLALSLSISCLSEANSAVQAVAFMRDRETNYTYVTPSSKLTRIVGVETVVTSMYKAYEENFQIRFYKADGTDLVLYYRTDNNGNRIKKDNVDIPVTYIDLKDENYANAEEAITHLNFLLGNYSSYKSNYYYTKHSNLKKYEKQLNDYYSPDGLYNFFAGKTFIENLGEYYQGTDSTKIKKRVITYTIFNDN